MVDLGPLNSWDRQSGESAPAYEAFLTYRDLGYARSTAATAQKLGKSKTLMDRWSGQWNWVARTEAWDSMPSAKLVEAYEEMATRVAEQHERVATKLMARLEQHLDALDPGKVPSQTWSIAHGAGRQGHQFAAELSKPRDEAKSQITDAIENLLSKLAGEE